MKVNFDKMFFYFLLIFVSGSIGYAIKPETKENKIQQESCIKAMKMMEGMSRKTYHSTHQKTKKQIAIERMMNN